VPVDDGGEVGPELAWIGDNGHQLDPRGHVKGVGFCRSARRTQCPCGFPGH
jgi:hypothetical protein